MNAIAPTAADDSRDLADIRTDNRFRWLVTSAGVFVLVSLAAAAGRQQQGEKPRIQDAEH